MTSELVHRKAEDLLTPHEPDCLCCFHFAIPLEDLPESSLRHRARHVKRKKVVVVAATV